MGHGHTHLGGDTLDRRLTAVVALNVAIVLAETVGGTLSGSLALFSDAAHNLSDVVAVALALWVRGLGRRPPTLRHTYGLKRAEVISSFASAVLLLGVNVFIARAAVLRLLHPEPVAQGIMLVVALAALAANLGSMALLHEHPKGDVNVRSAFLHMAQDSVATLAVVLAALFAHTAVGTYADPVVALLVGLVVLRSSFFLAWETLSTILEGVPSDVDVIELAAQVDLAFPPAKLHHVHVWEIGPDQRLLTAHVTLGRDMGGCQIEELLGRIKAFLHERWRINHSTLEPEIGVCAHPGLLGCWDDGLHEEHH